MGQEDREGGLLQPLVLAGADELVKYDLRGVRKVAKLRLPDDQSVGILVAVPQLEAQHCVLGQDGVARNEGLLRPEAQVVQEDVGLVGGLVVHRAVPVGEGAALHVLPGDPHVAPLEEQRAERKSLCGSPVEAVAGLDALPLVLHDPLEAVVQLEALRHIAEPEPNLLQQVDVNARRQLLSELVWRAHAFPFRGQPLGALGGLVRLRGRVVLLELLPNLVTDLLQHRRLCEALADEAVAEDVQAPLVLADGFVEQRLREVRVVALVVAEAAIADNVQDHIVSPLLAVLSGQLECAYHGKRVICVAMQDWHAEAFAQIGAIPGRPRIDRVCGETNLVVHDDVDGAANIKVLDLP
mmetsp:Transcript_29538/g.79755  ORF Transcript_29538/g.79755 Transcript_29538/m.79755 type:complete len:353 (-) Transcript_29538:515-1573(-)